MADSFTDSKELKCSVCNKPVEQLYDKKCEDCYDAEYSGLYGGGCLKGD